MQQVAEGVYVETGYDGVNVGAIATRRNVICIDSPSYPKDARHWAMRLRQISGAPLQFLVLLDHNGDRVMNARWLNTRLITHEISSERLISFDKRFPQPLIDSLIDRNPAAGRELASAPVERPDFSFTSSMRLIRDDTEIVLRYAPGPTMGSIWVYLPQHGVLFAGDSIVNETHPPLQEADIRQWQATLAFLDQAMPDVQIIVPGRGPIGDRRLIAQMTAYLEKINSAAREQLENGSQEPVANQVADILNHFPASETPLEWAQQQVRAGIDRVYNEMVHDAVSNGAAS